MVHTVELYYKMMVTDGPSGRSMGLGVDGSTRAVYWASGVTKSFNFDNSQIVSIGDNNPKTAYFYSEENSNFKSTFNNCDFWGQPQRGLILNSGNLTLYGAHFNNPGQQTLASVSNASLNILASASNQNGSAFVDSGSEKNISISGSILNNRNNNAGSFKAFDSNMGLRFNSIFIMVLLLRFQDVIHGKLLLVTITTMLKML